MTPPSTSGRAQRPHEYDAVVVGAGPNGLAAAIEIARAGRSVCVLERNATIGGGARSAPLTLPGFVHDVGAAVHALALVSPFMRSLPLHEFGMTHAHADAPFAHPLDDGTAVMLERDITRTADGLGARDGRAYIRTMSPLLEHHERIFDALLDTPSVRGALGMTSFAMHAWQPATLFAKWRFHDERARALFAGAAAHAMVPLGDVTTAGYGLGLVLSAHAVGWPVATGGSGAVIDAMAAYLRSLGGEIRTECEVTSLGALPRSRAVLLDVTPRQLLRIAGDALPSRYRRRLRAFRYGPAAFKMDWALREPVPWRDPAVRRAGTVHLGGTLAEIAAAERAVWHGEHTDDPYVLLVQPSVADPTRAPAGRHTLWAYCHVPNGSTVDMTERMTAQIERFAPGFRDCVLHASVTTPAAAEASNPNLVGGDIAGGAGDVMQLFARPVLSADPYRTPLDGVYLCSASTPPGIGVHGMCGARAARSALRHSLGG